MKLLKIVEEILCSDVSKEEKVMKLISLAEEAYQAGDMRAYSEIMDKVIGLYPELKKESEFLTINSKRIGSKLPDFD